MRWLNRWISKNVLYQYWLYTTEVPNSLSGKRTAFDIKINRSIAKKHPYILILQREDDLIEVQDELTRLRIPYFVEKKAKDNVFAFLFHPKPGHSPLEGITKNMLRCVGVVLVLIYIPIYQIKILAANLLIIKR